MGTSAKKAIKKVKADKSRLMDILIDIQEAEGCVSEEALKKVASKLKMSLVDVRQTATFYHFITCCPTGKNTIYLNNSAVAEMNGRDEVAQAFEDEAGCKFGSVTSDGTIGLFNTSCIGMNDQEPAAIINNVVYTKLDAAKAKQIIQGLKSGKNVKELTNDAKGDGQNSNPLVNSMVVNNIKKAGEVVFADYTPGTAIAKCLATTPEKVIEEITKSNLRGRGGAGFPTGMKWDFCSKSEGDRKFVFCNADEGEPGTFKDRVILTEKPELVFEGMAVASYAIGAKEGILYLRYEYKYLEAYLEDVLKNLRSKNILGKNFDIRIQFGAGAYVCGEESALIESAEGKRGEPRDRPPFPVEKGYLNLPTVINNVETLCAAARIMEKGAEWYKGLGTKESSGTKLLSISGDCKNPGVYEIEWGMTIKEMIDMVGAGDVQAVQVSGPSGVLLAPKDFNRVIGYEDLATGGSMIIVNNNRDLLDIVMNFTSFFIEESCGSCTPCRAMTTVLQKKLQKVVSGKGVAQDIEDMATWGKLMSVNRCGLGQTAANPILTSIKNFKNLYDAKVQKSVDYDQGFNMEAAVSASCEAVSRTPNL